MKTLLIAIMITTGSAWAGDDPSIKGELRQAIKEAMMHHVEATTIDGRYVIYDVVEGKLKKLKFAELHEGVVKKGDFFVSCADFVDAAGHKYDLDFLVAKKGDRLRVFQGLVHSIDGAKRAYHLEHTTE